MLPRVSCSFGNVKQDDFCRSISRLNWFENRGKPLTRQILAGKLESFYPLMSQSRHYVELTYEINLARAA